MPPVCTGEASIEGTPIVSVIVIQFITLDGIVSDPDGAGGTPSGGWAFRHGPETVAGDKFRLGSALMAEDLVDDYRLLTFPTILGTGERLFPTGGQPAYLECLSSEGPPAGPRARSSPRTGRAGRDGRGSRARRAGS
jgi:hypothetical protein